MAVAVANGSVQFPQLAAVRIAALGVAQVYLSISVAPAAPGGARSRSVKPADKVIERRLGAFDRRWHMLAETRSNFLTLVEPGPECI